MKRKLYCILFFLVGMVAVQGQSKSELEARRKKTLDEIEYVDNLLKTTEKEKNASLDAIKMIDNKLILRENMIKGMQDEMELLNERISLNTIAVDMMESDLINLKEDYRKAIVNSYRIKKGNPEIVYILSAKDFNQGYKRLKYLQQFAVFRRSEAEIIVELKDEIEEVKIKLETDLARLNELVSRQERQKTVLKSEQIQKEKMVKSLTSKERQLKKELEEKRRIAKKIEAEIARIMEAERKKVKKSEDTPEQKLIGDNFYDNRGRLPWPVEKGIITSHFGIQKNPDLKYLTEDNIGIEITSSGNVSARSVFQGEVVNVFAIRGANMTVIIRHGKYLSVYSNIVNVKVKSGEKVKAKEEIGEIYSDPDNSSSVLKFMIFESKYLDPEVWLSKN